MNMACDQTAGKQGAYALQTKRGPGFLADTHVHSEFSQDSEAKIPDICAAAAEMGVNAVCITDHCDVKPYSDLEQMAQVRKNVCDAVAEARQKTDAVELLVGIELACGAFYPESEIFSEVAKRILSVGHYDCVIGSVHSVQSTSTAKSDYSTMNHQELVAYVARYLDAILSMLEHGQPDILAHMTYPLRYINGKHGRNLDWRVFQPQIERILQTLISKEIALEINTSCLGSSYDQWVPSKEIVDMYIEMGGRLLTLGSDAHKPERLCTGFEEAKAYLRQKGIRYLVYFKDRIPCQYEI